MDNGENRMVIAKPGIPVMTSCRSRPVARRSPRRASPLRPPCVIADYPAVICVIRRGTGVLK